MRAIANNNISELELSKLSELKTDQYAYKNIMYIIAAYAARKLGFIELEKELIEKCSNKLFKDMWKNWTKSRKRKS